MKKNLPLRVILDTNLLVSNLISNSLVNLDHYFDARTIRLLSTQNLKNEFLEVVSRPKFRKYFPVGSGIGLFNMLETSAENVEIKSSVSVCRDEKDNFLLALAKDGQADFLVTGDSDLLILKEFGETAILKHTDFLILLSESGTHS